MRTLLERIADMASAPAWHQMHSEAIKTLQRVWKGVES